jgi:hypothetical protein
VGGKKMIKSIDKILKAAVTAPSGDNSQPWYFKIKENKLYIYNIPDRDNPILNFEQSGSYIAHGALIENIDITAPYFGYRVDIDIFPNKDEENLVATCTFNKQAVDANLKKDPLYSWIFKRATNRRFYENKRISEKVLSEIRMSANKISGIQLSLIEDGDRRNKLGGASSVSEIVILSHKELHHHMFKNVIWSEQEEKIKKSGLYMKTMELNPVQNFVFWLCSKPKIMKWLQKIGLPYFIASQDEKRYSSGYVTGGLISKNSNPIDFINSGRALQRVWLKATELGLAFQPITATLFFARKFKKNDKAGFQNNHIGLIEKAYLEIEKIFDASSKNVTMMFRVGYAKPPSGRSSRKDPDIEVENLANSD